MHRLLLSILFISSLFSREYIAIIDFEGIGVTEDEAKVLTHRLTSELINLEVYQVVERTKMKSLLDEQKFQYSGCVSIKCAVQIGMMIGAKYMVVGSISKLGSSLSIDSRLLNVETSEAYYSGSYSHKGGIDGLLNVGMKSIAHQLCGMPFDNSSISTNNLYNSINTQDVFPYFSDLSKQLEYEGKRIYIEEDKGQKQIVSGGGSKTEVANPLGVILFKEKADYISVSEPVTTRFEKYHTFNIYQGKRQLNEFQFMEIIGLSDKVKKAEDEFKQQMKRYESFNKTTYYKYETKKLIEVQPYKGITWSALALGGLFIFASFGTDNDPELNEQYPNRDCEICEWGYGTGFKLLLAGGGLWLFGQTELKEEKIKDVRTTNPYSKPTMKPVLTTEQIKSLAESYNRRIYKEIQGFN